MSCNRHDRDSFVFSVQEAAEKWRHDEVVYPQPNEWEIRKPGRLIASYPPNWDGEYDDPYTLPLDEQVNHPAHYTQGKIECIEAIEAALTPEEYRGYLKGTAIKYIWREKYKGGDESLQKADWFIRRAYGDGKEEGHATKASDRRGVPRPSKSVRKATTTVDGAWGTKQAGVEAQGSLGEELCPF